MKLNELQQAVVDAPIDRPARVVAGAGTGKTHVLVQRYLRFLDDGIPPSRLLALTFTLKAADEMRQRIFRAVEENHPELLRELYTAWIMNFHAFGFRIIRENAPAFGIDPGVDVVSEAELRRIDRTLKTRFLSGRIDGVPADFGGAIPPPAGLESLFKVCLGVVKKCRGDLIPIENLFAAIRPDDTTPYKAIIESIAAMYDAYSGEMERRNLIDFNDMIGLAARGLEDNAELTAQYRARFDHILVDEFQDTSAAQFKLLEMLSDESYSKVTVVGDEKQSIYRWRDARVENIREFPGDDLPLSVNYRSRQNILDLAHSFITIDPDMGARAVKLMAGETKPDLPIVLFHPADDQEGQQNDAEAGVLAAWVAHVIGDAPLAGVPPLAGDETVGFGDVAVLLRGVREFKVVPAIELAFRSAGIPYVILGGADAAGSRALELLYSFLSLLLPGDCRLQLLHVLGTKPFEVGHAAIAELIGRDGAKPAGRDELLSDERVARIVDADARSRLDQLRDLLLVLDDARASMDFRRFLATAIEETPFLLRLFAEDATTRSVEDLVGELREMCDTLDARRELGLWSFLDHLRAAIDERSFGNVEQLAVPADHVRIMTIHQAKGLEFPAVAVAGIKPSRSDTSGFFLSKTEGVFSDSWKDWNRGYKETDERNAERALKLQEERCLLYVAMTRARDLLFVSSPYADTARSLFGDVLVAAEESGVRCETLRSIPGELPVIERERGGGVTADADATPVVAEWRAARERHARQLAVTAVPAGPVHFVNWTALRAFAGCPLQYNYRYVLRFDDPFTVVPGDPDGDHAAPSREDTGPVRIPRGVTPVQYGLLAHELLRESMAARIGGTDPPAGWIEASAGRFGVAAKHRRGVAGSASKLVGAFESSEISRPGDDVRLEEPFQVRLAGIVYHGIFDRVERTGDGWAVTDYKIGVERDEYAFQVGFYAWALGRITGEDSVTGRVCYLRESECVTRSVAVENAEIDGLVSSLEKSLSDGGFSASPGDLCPACPYAITCPEKKS